MKQKVYVMVFKEFSDWEAPYALWAIAESDRFNIETVGFSKEPVKSKCGMRALPDVAIEEVTPEDAALFIVPGGDMWEQSFPATIDLFQKLNEEDVPVAAICGATLEVIRAGLAREKQHTSNDLNYVKTFVPDYGDENFYVKEPAVTGGNLITANGLSPIEFGREVIKLLKIYNDQDAEKWFEACKTGVYRGDF